MLKPGFCYSGIVIVLLLCSCTERMLSHYDWKTPDTKDNKSHFREFFGFEPPSDVKNLYCYVDEFGIDAKYQFSFSCDTATVIRIIENLRLEKAEEPDNYSQNLWHPFPWWDRATIVSKKPYCRKIEQEQYWYLWFDRSKRTVYYFTFGM